MDRNYFHAPKYHRILSLSARRAWIEIIFSLPLVLISPKSLSARRAWIEISGGACARLLALVALRKESVDRNEGNLDADLCVLVALRKESVDRNLAGFGSLIMTGGRSPQGERG